MSTYLIGDIHGCYDNFNRILDKIKFDINQDYLWLTGDLVAKGPNSLQVLRLVYSFNDKAKIVLGNHDIYLLATYKGITKNKLENKITQILKAPDSEELINWLRYQPILQIDKEKKIIMTHAGLKHTWSIQQSCYYAKQIENMLKSNDYQYILNILYNEQINQYNNPKKHKIKHIIDVFTRMRYCYSNGILDMNYKDKPQKSPEILYPWFSLPRKHPIKYNIIFGHWSSLMGYKMPKGIFGLDYGCYRSGLLPALRWEDKKIII